MRKSLLNSFDKIYILDLHGNAKKRETAPDGSKDENIFNIMQGVGIALFVKTGKKKKGEPAEVWHSELYGRRDTKLEALESHDVNNINWNKLSPLEPYYFFTPKDFSQQEKYDKGFKMDELFVEFTNGIKTHKDKVNISFTEQEANKILTDFTTLDVDDLKAKYIIKESSDWKLQNAIKDLKTNRVLTHKYFYRVLDNRYVNYTGEKGMMGRPRSEVMKNLIFSNISLITTRQTSTGSFKHIFVSDCISDINSISLQTREASFVFPLYVNKENMGKEEKVPNFKAEIYNKIADGLGIRPKPEELFDYIYAVLYSPSYREKYKEFLKIDFPRVPYPTDKAKFEALLNIGHELINLHLMRDAEKWEVTTGFPESGTNKVDKYQYADGKVWINNEQYFSDVSSTAWNEFIGGYQPAQKWLKDRSGRQLSYDDIIHYERIIYVLDKTQSIMKKIDNISM